MNNSFKPKKKQRAPFLAPFDFHCLQQNQFSWGSVLFWMSSMARCAERFP